MYNIICTLISRANFNIIFMKVRCLLDVRTEVISATRTYLEQWSELSQGLLHSLELDWSNNFRGVQQREYSTHHCHTCFVNADVSLGHAQNHGR